MPLSYSKFEAVSPEEVVCLFDQLRALDKTELASLFRVSPTTIYNWMTKGISESSQIHITTFLAVNNALVESGVQRFLEELATFQPGVLQTPLKRRCVVLYPDWGEILRCDQRRMDSRGLCVEHKRHVAMGMSFLTVSGRVVGDGRPRQNASLPRRCNFTVRNGNRCPVNSFDGTGFCVEHRREVVECVGS
jgi:hypothetical protein